MTELRCPRCGALLAELLDGKVAITCRKCHTTSVFVATTTVQTAPPNGTLRLPAKQ